MKIIYVDDSLHKQLKIIAAEKGLTIGKLIGEVIKNFVEGGK